MAPAQTPRGRQQPYEVLGVRPDASPASVKRAFHTEAKKWHPDKRPQGESEEESEFARSHFVAVHDAYERLMRQRESSSRGAGYHGADYAGGPDAAAVGRAEENLRIARSRLEEAEEYLAQIHEACRAGLWSAAQEQSLRSTARRAWRAVECLRREVYSAEVALRLEQGSMRTRVDTRDIPEPPAKVETQPTAQAPPLDGPRGWSDVLPYNVVPGVGYAFQEIAFDLWSAVMPTAVTPSWVSAASAESRSGSPSGR